MLLFPCRGHFTAENNIMHLLLFITKSGLTNSTTHNFCDYCLTYQSHYSRSEKFLLLIFACRNGHLFEFKKKQIRHLSTFPALAQAHPCPEKCSNTVVYSKCCVQRNAAILWYTVNAVYREMQQYCGVQ